MLAADPVSLASELIRFPSVNPPGDEAACAAFLGRLLAEAGFDVEAHEFAPGRPSLVARLAGSGPGKPLCFTGHLDVVPPGSAAWSVPPFAGEISEGKLWGRGSSDMKAGVAAFAAAAMDAARAGVPLRRGLTLIVTAGEETGCEGAFHLGRLGVLGEAELLIVAEPTSNQPILAHKGSLRIRVSARGRTAHSSMPEPGDNAVVRAAGWIAAMQGRSFGAPAHPLLGPGTAAVTTFAGGENINSVPDRAAFTVDFRTLPGQAAAHLLAEVQGLFGPEAAIETVTGFPGFSTGPDEPALVPLMNLLTERRGRRPVPGGAPYFTDASALVPALGGAPTVVIGPGEAAQCHRTDEFCFVERIREARDIYAELIGRVCRREGETGPIGLRSQRERTTW